jgi:hypothetical protein
MLHQTAVSSQSTTTRRDERRMRQSEVAYNEFVGKAEAQQQRTNRALEESIKFLGGEIDIIFA